MQSKNHDLRQPPSRGYPSIPRFIRPHPRQPAPPPPSSPPPTSLPPSSAYRSPLPEVTTHYHTRRSSPRLPLIVFHPVLPFSLSSWPLSLSLFRTAAVFHLAPSNVPGQPCPSSRSDHLLKRPNDAERVFPFALDGDTRHGSTSGHSSGAEFHAFQRDHPRFFDIKGGPLEHFVGSPAVKPVLPRGARQPNRARDGALYPT